MMRGIEMTNRLENMKTKIILLWVVVMINMIFADIFSFMFLRVPSHSRNDVDIRNNHRDSDCHDFPVLGIEG